jgi:hypothetical protein
LQVQRVVADPPPRGPELAARDRGELVELRLGVGLDLGRGELVAAGQLVGDRPGLQAGRRRAAGR